MEFLNQWLINRQLGLTNHQMKKHQKQLDLEKILKHPEDKEAYRNALHHVALKQVTKNFNAFTKWLFKDLVLLAIPYFSFGWYQIGLQNLVYTNFTGIANIRVWAMQENLNLNIMISGALLIVCGIQIMKNGWFHAPYPKGNLREKLDPISKKK